MDLHYLLSMKIKCLQILDKKKIIFESFYDTIIPFWTEEVEHVVVEGKTKIFDVFVVDWRGSVSKFQKVK